LARKPPRQNLIRDFMKEAHKCGLEPQITVTTLPDGSTTTEMRAVDRTARPTIISHGIRPGVAKAIEKV